MNDPKVKYKADTWLMRRPWIAGLLAFLLLGAFSFSIVIMRYTMEQGDEKKVALHVAESTKNKLQQSLQYSLPATLALTLIIDKEGTPQNFDSIAAYILQSNQYIDALELAPGGVIRYIYPQQGNESAIGFNILADSTRNKEAYRAIEKKELFFAGSPELKQDGSAVAGRLPVFIHNKFWGFSAVIIRMPTLLEAAGIDITDSSDYYYQLSRINPDTQKEEFFLPVREKSPDYTEVTVPIYQGEWKLSVIPVNGYKPLQAVIPIALLSLILTVTGVLFAVYLARTPARLQKMIWEKTTALEKSEKRNKDIVNALPDIVFVVDREGKFIDYNNPAEQSTFVPTEQFIGKKVTDVLPPHIAGEILSNLEKVRATRQLITHSYQLTKDKKTIDYEARYISQGNGDVLVLVRNVSESKKAEQRIRDSEQKYRTLVEQATDGIFIADLEGRLVVVNPAGSKMSQYAIEELLEMRVQDLTDAGELRAMPLKMEEIIAGKTATSERKLRRKDGELIDVEVSAKLIGSGRFLAFVRDITQRKKAEQALKESENRLKTILDTDPECIKLMAPDMTLIDINSSGIRMVGADNIEQIRGKSMLGVVAEAHREQTAKLVAESFEGKSGTFEFEMITLTGIHRWCEIHVVPFRNADGNIIAALGVTRDMTNWKITEEKLKGSFEEIRRLTDHLQNIREEERMNVAREIHDELGQQLTVLKMDVSRLGKKIAAKEEGLTPLVSQVIDAINNMVETVRKISSQLRPGLLDDLGLVATLEWYCNDFSKRTGIRTIFISGTGEEKLPGKISVSLFRIFQESLTNVVRHSEAKQVDVSLMQQGQQLILLIEDNGKGFDPEATKHKKTLGIMGMKERAIMIGGTYNVYSTPAKGTVIEVIVSLPDAEANEQG